MGEKHAYKGYRKYTEIDKVKTWQQLVIIILRGTTYLSYVFRYKAYALQGSISCP